MEGLIKFIKEEDGVTAIEYALIGSLIALVIILAVTNVGTRVRTIFENIAAGI